MSRYKKERRNSNGATEYFDSYTNTWVLATVLMATSSNLHAESSTPSFSSSSGSYGGGGSTSDFGGGSTSDGGGCV